MRTILGRLTSVNVMKVVWACEELGLSYVREDVGGAFGGNRTAEYLAMNPNGLIPVLREDDGFVLWESNAIIRYLGSVHASPLWPTTPRPRALLERWMDWQLSVLAGPMRTVFWTLVRTPDEERDMAGLARAAGEAALAWSILDAHLRGNVYVGGAAFTLADIPLGCFAHRWFNLAVARPQLAALQAWYGRLLARPAYAQYVARPLE